MKWVSNWFLDYYLIDTLGKNIHIFISTSLLFNINLTFLKIFSSIKNYIFFCGFTIFFSWILKNLQKSKFVILSIHKPDSYKQSIYIYVIFELPSPILSLALRTESGGCGLSFSPIVRKHSDCVSGPARGRTVNNCTCDDVTGKSRPTLISPSQ